MCIRDSPIAFLPFWLAHSILPWSEYLSVLVRGQFHKWGKHSDSWRNIYYFTLPSNWLFMIQSYSELLFVFSPKLATPLFDGIRRKDRWPFRLIRSRLSPLELFWYIGCCEIYFVVLTHNRQEWNSFPVWPAKICKFLVGLYRRLIQFSNIMREYCKTIHSRCCVISRVSFGIPKLKTMVSIRSSNEISLIKTYTSIICGLIIDSHNDLHPVGLIAQLVQDCTGVTEFRGFVPFRPIFFYCSSCIAKLRRSLTLKLFPSVVQMKFHWFNCRRILMYQGTVK